MLTTIRCLIVLTALALLGGCGGSSGRQGTDISVSGTGPTGQVLGGQNAVFNMTVSNLSSNPAANVRIVDNLGNQLKLLSITCTATGGATCPSPVSVQMDIPTFPGNSSMTFQVTAQAVTTANGTVQNTMSASYSMDTNSSNNVYTVQATAFTPVTNIVVSGTGPSGTITGGATATFLMTVTNNGPDAATSFNVVENPGSGLSLTGITCDGIGGAVCPATVGVVTPIASLPAGGTLKFTVTTLVGANVNGTVSNQLSVDVTTNPNRGANSFYATATVVTPQAGLFVTGVGPTGTVAGGSTAIFTMTVNNSGPSAATTVSIVDTVGSNVTFGGVTCTANGGATCPSPLGPVMTVPTLPVGGSLTFSVSGIIAKGTNGTVTNTMTVNASNDVNHTQHSATALATVATPHATLTVGGAIVTTPVSGGGTASYAMTVVNTGPDPATNLVLVNQVSGNQSFTSATCTATGGATCPATVGVVTNVGTLPVGGQITLNVNALVNATANGAITDTITATADNSFSVNGNSAVAVGQAVSSVGNVTVVGSAPSTPVPSGGAASFAMTITNTGPGVVGPIQLVDTVGGNLTLQGITCSAAGGATCPSVPGPQMTVATLPVNGSLTFTVATTVQAGTQGSIINTLDAAVTGGTTGRVSGVAIGSAYSADLSVEAVSPSGPLTGGSTAAFTMVVTNNGPSTSQNVTLTNTLGAGATLGSISCIATAGATCPAAPTSPISVPSIPASGVLTFTVPFTVAASTSTPVTDTFTATAAGDGRTGNNSATGSVSVVAVDLTLSQSAPATVPFGTNAVFTAIVANQSRVAASDVAVSYALTGAAGTTATVGCTPSVGATCPTTLGSSMTVPSLPAGAYLTFTFTAPVPTTVAGSKTITNTVTISSPEDANPTGSPATTTTTAADPRNGTYTLYAANGHAYSMAINFDNASYTITGNGQTITKAFSADTSNGCNNCYTVTGGSPVAKFRTAVNLIVGGEDFGSGAVLPYIAGVTFGTTIEQLGALYGGPYNLVFQTFAANGTSTIAPATVRFSGNVMQVCTATSPVATPATCPASQLQSYTVTVDPTTFTYTATNTSGPGSFSFQLAQTGASTVLLGSNLVSGVGQSFYGLPDAAAIAGGSLEGASLDHNWVTMILTPNSYSYTGQLGGTDHATLSHISANSGPFSMLTGTLTNGSPVYVMQAYPVAIAFGVGISGLLQVTVP